MFPEVLQEGEEKGERELENLGNSGNAVLGQRHAKVLLDRADEHIVRLQKSRENVRFSRAFFEG